MLFECIDFFRIQVWVVVDFKYFLEYVECGVFVFGVVVYGLLGDFELFFEIVVVRVLQEKGWEFYF